MGGTGDSTGLKMCGDPPIKASLKNVNKVKLLLFKGFYEII